MDDSNHHLLAPIASLGREMAACIVQLRQNPAEPRALLRKLSFEHALRILRHADAAEARHDAVTTQGARTP